MNEGNMQSQIAIQKVPKFIHTRTYARENAFRNSESSSFFSCRREKSNTSSTLQLMLINSSSRMVNHIAHQQSRRDLTYCILHVFIVCIIHNPCCAYDKIITEIFKFKTKDKSHISSELQAQMPILKVQTQNNNTIIIRIRAKRNAYMKKKNIYDRDIIFLNIHPSQQQIQL